MILANFVLQVAQKLPTKFQVNWPFRSGEEALNRFLIGMILAILDLQAALILPTKFLINWPFDSGEAQNRFLR